MRKRKLEKARNHRIPHRKRLKSWNLARRLRKFFCLERAPIVRVQGASEDKHFAAKPTPPNSHFLSDFGIKSYFARCAHEIRGALRSCRWQSTIANFSGNLLWRKKVADFRKRCVRALQSKKSVCLTFLKSCKERLSRALKQVRLGFFKKCQLFASRYRTLLLTVQEKQLLIPFPKKKGLIAVCCLLGAMAPVFFMRKQERLAPAPPNNSSSQFFSIDSSLKRDRLLCLNASPLKGGSAFGNELEADSLLFFQEIEIPSPVRVARSETPSLPANNDQLIASASSESLLTSSARQRTAETSGQQGTSELIPQRLSLSNMQATNDGFGDVQSYWSLNVLLAPTFKMNHYMPFIDLRWNTFNDCRESNKFAGTIGVGFRDIPQNNGIIWGANVYYDYRHGSIGKGWNQVGLGAELLGKVWEFHANAYLPVGRKSHMRKCKSDGAVTEAQREYEFVYTGFDAELGCRAVRTKNYTVYIGAGPYYINGKFSHEAWGIRGRFRPQYKDYVALDFMVTHDHVFKTIYQGELIVSVPFYALGSQKKKKTPSRMTQEQIYQRVERLDVISVGKTCH